MNQKGVTLVELLLAVAVMGIIIVPVVAVSQYAFSSHQKIVYQNELQYEARLIIEQISNHIRKGAYWELDHGPRLVQPVYGGPDLVALRYEDATNTVYAMDGSLRLSEQVKSFQVILLPSAQKQRFILELVLEHAATKETYALSLRMNERNKLIEYQLNEEEG